MGKQKKRKAVARKQKKAANQLPEELQYRNKEQRQSEVKTLLGKLSEFQLTSVYEPIKQLYKHFQDYIHNNRRIQINIPFPEIDRRITGLLALSIKEKVWLNLLHETEQ